MHLPGVKPGSIAWKAIILTVGLQTLACEISEQKLKVIISCTNIYLTNFQVHSAQDQILLQIVRVCVLHGCLLWATIKFLLQWHITN